MQSSVKKCISGKSCFKVKAFSSRGKFEYWSTLLACICVQKLITNRLQCSRESFGHFGHCNTAVTKFLDQELFSELTEPLVLPLLVHMVVPFVNGDKKDFSLLMNRKKLWEWRKIDGNLRKLFAVLQANLCVIGGISLQMGH